MLANAKSEPRLQPLLDGYSWESLELDFKSLVRGYIHTAHFVSRLLAFIPGRHQRYLKVQGERADATLAKAYRPD